ncbi:hypothetical protein GP486_006127 [Trichoglossum hirsutum]|uniref:Translation initiation factor eIF2B subunit delta n=1 Tax=Trichoglossum hirsutum TaxID=265104 RepID=A0A9P8RL12_9PEZI|nr:hypothetical protein GP486_006127 [Trichoglossum hirsutum]
MAGIEDPFSTNFRIGFTDFFWIPLCNIIKIDFVRPELAPVEGQVHGVANTTRPVVLMADAPIPTQVVSEASELSIVVPSVKPTADTSAPQGSPETKAGKMQQNKKEPKPKDAKEGPGKQPRQPQGGDVSKESGLSAKALKEAKKADKQARRAQQKQTPPGLLQQQAQGKKAEGSKGGTQKEQLTPKGGHKRTGSAVTEAQRTVPIRSGGQQTPTTVESHAESKHVSLFRHLEGPLRRASILGAASSVHPAVLTLGLQMSSYEICGSTARCVATLLAFKRVIESYTTPPGTTLTRHLTFHLSHQITYLTSCRPISVSMGNAIRWLKLQITDIDIDTPESEAKAQLCDAVDNFIREKITLADKVIASSAGEKIRNGDVILTYAKSRIVQQALVDAYDRGTKFRVIVIDSRPLFEGRNLARALADHGLEVQYSLTHALSYVIKDVTKVFLGAHAMLSNGRLYSRVGTALVAMTAKDRDVPVIVCCESVKFTDRVNLDSIVTNELAPPDELVLSLPDSSTTATAVATAPTVPTTPSTPSTSAISLPSTSPPGLPNWRHQPNLNLLNLMYDVTPAEYIKMVITEFGSLPPSSVPVLHRISTEKSERFF